MRNMAILGGLLIILGAQTPVHAQVVQKEITQPNAEVRCLPGDANETIFTTNVLALGEWVSVVEDQGNGWLKILPPRGSFSWINKKDLVAGPRYAGSPNVEIFIVNSDSGTKTFVGSDKDPKKKGNVFGAALPKGVLVKKVQRDSFIDHEGEWLPIEPPTGPTPEYRYLRKDAVATKLVAVPNSQPNLMASNFTGTSTSATQTVVGSQPPVVPGTVPPPGQPTDAQKLWQQAQQAERAGDLNMAMDLYSQMATRTPATSFDHDLAMQGLNRVYFLRESQRSPVTNTVPAMAANPTTAATVARYTTQQPQANPAVRINNPPPANPYPVNQAQPMPTATAGTSTPPGQQEAQRYTTCQGNLTRAGRGINNRKTYVFQGTDASGSAVRLYVSPQTGVDLEPYLTQRLELTGPMVYNGELRANYMIAEQVRIVP